MRSRLAALAATMLALTACNDAPTAIGGHPIVKYHRSEVDAARILAYANTAAVDALIACFDSKFAYWFHSPHTG